MRATRCLLLLLAMPCMACAQQSAVESSVLLENGRVWTNDPDQPMVSAIVIEGDRIVWVGDSEAAPVTPTTRRIDLRGHRVVPGFNDAHTHFIDGGFTLLAPDLLTSDSAEEFVHRLGEYARTLPPGRWIDLHAAWDHERWPGHPLPSRDLIDPVTPDNPVWMRRPDGHIGLVNSLALELAGVDRSTPDPPGGRIDRDANGNPTGILRDAHDLIRPSIPPISEDQYREALDAALAHAARIGVTSVQDICD